MHKKLYKFIEMHSLLHPLQFDFREKHSTLHTLVTLTESVMDSIDNGSYGCRIFIDLQTVFDTVNHQILLQKLEHYGIRGIGLCWFSSYLSTRKQHDLLMATYLII